MSHLNQEKRVNDSQQSASSKTKEPLDHQDQASNFSRSRCGSIAGESFVFRQREDTCSLRSHSLTGKGSLANRRLAAELKAINEKQCSLPIKLDATKIPDASHQATAARLNSRFHGYRFVIVMLGGLAFGLMLMLRFSVSIALLQMVNRTELMIRENPDLSLEEILAETSPTSGEFVWDNEIQQTIMSYYMFAYTLPQMPCTKLALSVGSRLAMPISLAICALASLLTPWAAYISWRWVVALRLLNGLGAAAVLPLMLNLVESWMPYSEMSLGLTMAQMLQSFIMVCNHSFVGHLAGIHWSYAFYVPAIATLFFAALWPFLVSDSPDKHWLVSERELDIICGCPKDGPTEAHNHKLASRCQGEKSIKEEHFKPEEDLRPNWTSVFRVRTFYAYIFVWIFHCCTQNCFVFVLPLYLSQFLKASVSDSGALCSLVMLGVIVSVLWPHPAMRFLETKLKLSQTASRRVCFAFTCTMLAATGLLVGLFHQLQLILFFVNRCFQSTNDIVVTGSMMNNFAKSNLSSLVFSMVNTVGNLSVVFASSMIGFILDATGQSRDGWLMVYGLMSVGQLLILIVFCTLIRSDPIDLAPNPSTNNSIEDGFVADIQTKGETKT